MKKHVFQLLLFIFSLAFVACNNKTNPTVDASDAIISIDENPQAGMSVVTINANISGGNVQFNLVSQSVSGAFNLDSNTGILSVADPQAFDFETNPTLTATIEASIGSVTDNATITVNLNNVLEVVSTQDETITIDENPSNGDILVTVTGTTDLGSVSFDLDDESVAGAFALDMSTGVLTVADASLFDYELNTSLTATINVFNGSLSQTSIVTVNLNDLFEIAWTQATANAAFGGLYGHKIVDLNGTLFSIGGIRGIDRINEVWSSTDGITWTQVNTTNAFAPRNGHEAVIFDNKIWVIGGFTANGRTNDVWSSPDGANWTQVNTQGIFSPRADHAAVVFNNNIWVVGGSDGAFKNEVWMSSNGSTWSQVTTTGNLFTPRLGHSLTVFNGQMVLIAGTDLDGDQLQRQRNDIWMSTDGISWTEVFVSGNLFVERWLHGAIAYNNLLWVIGGDDDTGNRFNDVWTSPDGLNWTQQDTNPIFDVRDQMAIFSFNNSIWVSGGSNNSGILEDIWRTN
ncbi:hypothetical protein BFP97_07830 [Roseivirga sp. 4D4]|uniref:Kelch repeat-containing protein n=1 Tax=Roseivirga sp. 4D4 TaxID=1889784 RepID=UPI0008534CDB|nr:kelch repeat-containing protein [Roseivirga sp. 4D4]OEK01435.1 hypothetical protein BFP97_07830 [Roseivirga sp. 4D4]